MGNPEWTNLMEQALGKYVDPETSEKIIKGSENLLNLDESQQAIWMQQPLGFRNNTLKPKHQKKKDITTVTATMFVTPMKNHQKPTVTVVLDGARQSSRTRLVMK